MGPLIVYEIISENTNLFLAFIIGIGFGFVLESNGFSSSRRLAGMFYGYDTTVLKVFFAIIVVQKQDKIKLNWLSKQASVKR